MDTVCFLAPWITSNNNYVKESLNILTPKNDGVWQKLTMIDDPVIAKYVIILDKETEESKKINFNKKIYLQREPIEIRKYTLNDYEYKNKNKYLFFGDYKNFYQVSVPWILKSYSFLKDSYYHINPRIYKFVTICSGKIKTEAQRKRLSFIKELTKHIDIHVYGKDLNYEDFNGKYKGSIKGKCKYNILKKYTYAIACENSQHSNYFTEKINDCFLSLTVPIYWGCDNIDNFFPKHSFHKIDCLDLTKMKTFCNKLNNLDKSLSENIIKNLYMSRDLVIHKYNIWASINTIIKQRVII